MNKTDAAAFKRFHQNAAQDALEKQPSIGAGGPLKGILGGELAPQLPWRDLLLAGVVQGGFARLVTSLDMLVVGRQVDALRLGWDLFGQDIWYYVPRWFREWLREDDPEASAHLYLNRPDFVERLQRESSVEEAFALGYGSQEGDAFKKRFIRYVSRDSYYGSSKTSRQPIFLGRQLSFRFAEANRDEIETFQQFNVKMAEGDDGVALLENLAARTKNPFVLCKLSDIWARLGEHEKPAELMRQAEECVDAGRLLACPWAQWQIFGNQVAARDFMETCIDSPEWVQNCRNLQVRGLLDFAELYRDLDHSPSYLSRIYSAAEDNARTLFDCDTLLVQYAISGQFDGVKRAIARAEKVARTSQEWSLLACIVYGKTEDEELLAEHMRHAESLAETSDDWGFCAGGWGMCPDNAQERKRCLDNSALLENVCCLDLVREADLARVLRSASRWLTG